MSNKYKCNSWELLGPDWQGKMREVCKGTKELDTCSCNGNRENCDFYTDVRKKGIRERLYRMNGGLIFRKELIEKLRLKQESEGIELPVWVWDIIEEAETGRERRNRRIKERNDSNS